MIPFCQIIICAHVLIIRLFNTANITVKIKCGAVKIQILSQRLSLFPCLIHIDLLQLLFSAFSGFFQCRNQIHICIETARRLTSQPVVQIGTSGLILVIIFFIKVNILFPDAFRRCFCFIVSAVRLQLLLQFQIFQHVLCLLIRDLFKITGIHKRRIAEIAQVQHVLVDTALQQYHKYRQRHRQYTLDDKQDGFNQGGISFSFHISTAFLTRGMENSVLPSLLVDNLYF